MRTFDRLQRGVRQRISEWIKPANPSELEAIGAFYPQQKSCQIPHLWWLYTRFLGNRSEGFFVEVGAYDGVFVSNTWGLARQGWTGLLFEPVPILAQRCAQNHSAHSAITVVQCAVGPKGVEEVKLMLGETLTTANSEVFGEYSEIDWAAETLTDQTLSVPCHTLDHLLEYHEAPCEFDVLVVDVEGFEDQVFSGFSLFHWRPKMMIVELADTHPDLTVTANSDAKLGEHLTASGYKVVFKDSVNTVFLREDVWAASFKAA